MNAKSILVKYFKVFSLKKSICLEKKKVIVFLLFSVILRGNTVTIYNMWTNKVLIDVVDALEMFWRCLEMFWRCFGDNLEMALFSCNETCLQQITTSLLMSL